MQYKGFEYNNSIDAFAHTTTVKNLMAITEFFETICIDIFKYLLTAVPKNGGFLGPMSTYFVMVEIND